VLSRRQGSVIASVRRIRQSTLWKFSPETLNFLIPQHCCDTASKGRSIDLVPESEYKRLLLKVTPFDAIRIQRRISALSPVKMLLECLPKFTTKKKSGSYSVYSYCRIALRWLNTVSGTYIWMGRCSHSLSLDATIMVSKNCSIIGEHVVIIFLTSQVTIATVWPLKNTLNYSFRGL